MRIRRSIARNKWKRFAASLFVVITPFLIVNAFGTKEENSVRHRFSDRGVFVDSLPAYYEYSVILEAALAPAEPQSADKEPKGTMAFNYERPTSPSL